MADEIKKIQIKNLPQKSSVGDENLIVIDDEIVTYKITADDIAKYVSTNEHMTNKYVDKDSIGVANGVTPLNSNKKIDGKYITYGNTSSTAYEGSAGKVLEENLDNHLTDGDAHGYATKINEHTTNISNPHKVTKAQVGLENVNNTSDTDKPVSTAQQKAIDTAYANSNAYTDQKIADLINGAPETLDTLKEVADAISASKSTEEALNKAIGTKASQTELDAHTSNDTVHITASERTNWNAAKTHADSAHAPSNAEANQNAFSNVKVGSTTVSAEAKTDSLTLEGKNATVTADVTNKRVILEITKNNVISALGYTPEEGGSSSSSGNSEYGECGTEGDVSEKVVTIPSDSTWTLKAGAIIFVHFANTNTASNCTINVNNTGAKPIWYNNAVYTGNVNWICGYANRVMMYVYDGTHWVWQISGIDNNSTYSNATLGQGYGTCTTAETTVTKAVTLSGYTLANDGIVAVKFSYGVPASATMNINSKGAKAIYYRGAAIKAGIIKAGDVAYFIYNGSQYILLGVDRDTNTDTKNTTGSSNTNKKIFLVGTETQTTASVTYSHSGAYVDEDGNLYSNDVAVSTTNHTHDDYVNITYSDTEPTTQRIGDLWCQDY